MTEPPATPGDPGRFEDHFGGHAAAYASGRPTYPAELFDRLADLAPARGLAWDVATGNGQAALALAERFDQVVASDASPDQLRHAAPHARITYEWAAAHEPPASALGADLICIAQALHWFGGPAFDAAVRRALRPGGIVAAWSYGRCTVDPAVDAVVNRLHDEILGPWWPERRRHVLDGYRGLDLPGEPVPFDAGAMQQRWSLADLLAYLGSWSALRRCRDAGGLGGVDPLDAVAAPLAEAWGDARTARVVRWPLASIVRRG